MEITINNTLFDVTIDPGYPGCFGGPPDAWEPPEPAYIEEVKVYLKSKKVWKTITEELPASIEERIWKEVEQLEDQTDYYYYEVDEV